MSSQQAIDASGGGASGPDATADGPTNATLGSTEAGGAAPVADGGTGTAMTTGDAAGSGTSVDGSAGAGSTAVDANGLDAAADGSGNSGVATFDASPDGGTGTGATGVDAATGGDAASSVTYETVTTPGGTFPSETYQGASDGSVASFLGIRYAAAPVGNLRFAAPQPPASVSGTISATQSGSPCPQSASPFGIASTQEDCLFLNVYVPASAMGQGGLVAPRVPVMVFFYGGAFVYGAASLYDPSDMVSQGDVIVVTVNYRLGILGFLAHSALDQTLPKVSSGTYGIADQQLALRWVQQNVGAFGGNPGNVTIFGESAGGFSVCAHLVSPSSAGLFSRAITESGPCSFPLPTQSTKEAQGTQIANTLGCSGMTAADTASCLRQAPLSQVLAAQDALTSANSLSSLSAFFPNVDGVIIPQQPLSLILLGQYNHVPVIEGTNHDEGRLFIALAYDLNTSAGPLTASQYPSAVGALASTLAQSASSPDGGSTNAQQTTTQILNQYPLSKYPSPDLALSAVFTDAGFACPASISNGLLSLGTTVFAYELTDPSPPMPFLPPVSYPYAAAHTTELPFLFAFPNHQVSFTADEQTLAKTMKTYFTNFAALGNPNGTGVPYWASTNALTPTVQSFVPPTPSASTNFATDHQCSFWTQILLGTSSASSDGGP